MRRGVPKLRHSQWLLLIFGLALFLRVPTIGEKSLWLDGHWNLVLPQPFYGLEVRSYRLR